MSTTADWYKEAYGEASVNHDFSILASESNAEYTNR